jgi:glycosyltransferase involved in cell wall biosynthesis
MGVNTDLFHPNKYNATLKLDLQIEGLFLLGVGRFAEIKGFRYLISAVPIILEKYPATKLVLIGFGPQEKELRSLISQLNLSNSVILPGSQSGVKLAEYFATADVFIGPSVVTPEGAMEGQGLVFLEAMASKTAVIASKVGGIIDMIEDGRTGLLVPQKDPESIAAKVLLLARDKDLREKLAYNAKEVVENRYSWEVVADAFVKTYQKILYK